MPVGEKRRNGRAFASDARWGRFSAIRESRFGPWGPIVCGVCGITVDYAAQKADHLEHEHHATVIITEADNGETVYEWRRDV